MARYLEILGTAFSVPDPDSVASLAASFGTVRDNLGDTENDLGALRSPEAWAEWTGQAADAFARSLGQLPGELSQARQSYATVAAVLSGYAAGLGPVVAALSALALEAEDAESTLQAVTAARNQARAQGQDTAITGWDARLDDATETVAALRARRDSLVREMDDLSAQCVQQIRKAQHQGIQNTVITDFDRYVVQDGGVALHDASKAADDVGHVAYEAFVQPFTSLGSDLAAYIADPDAHTLGALLEDVGNAVGVVALAALVVAAFVPGTDAFAIPALAEYLGDYALAVHTEAAAADVAAAVTDEPDASWGDVGWDALSLGSDGLGGVVGDGVPGAVFGVGFGLETTAFQDGVEHVLSVPAVAASGPDVLDGIQVMHGAVQGLQGLPAVGAALQPSAAGSALQPASAAAASPATVTVQHVTLSVQPTVSQGMGMLWR
jgi:hypothetical protein